MAKPDGPDVPEGLVRSLLSLLRESGDALEAACPPFNTASAELRLRERARTEGFLRASGVSEDDLWGTDDQLEQEAPPFDMQAGAERLRQAATGSGLLASSASEDSGQAVTDDRKRQVHQAGPGSVHGVLVVYSAPPALCPHIEWAVAGVVGSAVSMSWLSQPADSGSLCAELAWKGRAGTGGAITSALAGWNRLRFEVTEESSPGCNAVRYSYTPTLGIFSATMGVDGNILVPENLLRAAVVLEATDPKGLEQDLARLLGTAWENELEPFRRAPENARSHLPGLSAG
jgi:hypothetical protein